MNKLIKEHKIKCVVWDLDNTLWKGILLEGDKITLRDGVIDVIKGLDKRGILQSISSKNEYSEAMDKLEEFGLGEYFLYPQINWNAKSSSIKTIAESINIGIDTIAFIDDQIYEREEVKYTFPEVMVIDAKDIEKILDMPEMNPIFITIDSTMRRKMYLEDIERKEVEKSFKGSQEEFLASLSMILKISNVGEDDLKRAEELTVRTNQLNATGYTYSYSELDALRFSTNHKLLIADLEDIYGSYGKIGLALIECGKEIWRIKLLLMSCRVVSRGVGAVLLNHIINLAIKEKVRLQAEYIFKGRNRMMYIMHKFAGFNEIAQDGDIRILECDLSKSRPFPYYIKLDVES